MDGAEVVFPSRKRSTALRGRNASNHKRLTAPKEGGSASCGPLGREWRGSPAPRPLGSRSRPPAAQVAQRHGPLRVPRRRLCAHSPRGPGGAGVRRGPSPRSPRPRPGTEPARARTRLRAPGGRHPGRRARGTRRGSPDDAPVTSPAAGGISRPLPGAGRDPALSGRGQRGAQETRVGWGVAHPHPKG